MITATREERRWFVRNLAQGLTDYMGATEPPVDVEGLLRHPPDIYSKDFGVVDMFSNLWDATFARPLTQRGNVFVHMNLPPGKRRFALARETLSALITSKHGRKMGLAELLLSDLRDASEFFARCLAAPDRLVRAFKQQGGQEEQFADTFGLPAEIAAARWEDELPLAD